MVFRNMLLISAIGVFLFGCSQDTVLKKYYILDDSYLARAQMDSVHHPVIPLVCQINDLKISKAYDQNRIALRSNTNELTFFYYHNWADSPGSAVRYYLWSKMKSLYVFKESLLEYTTTQPDVYINGNIEQIERTDYNDEANAHLKMALELVNVKSDEILLRYTMDRSLPIESDSNMNLFTQKISQILDEETESFIARIRDYYGQSK